MHCDMQRATSKRLVVEAEPAHSQPIKRHQSFFFLFFSVAAPSLKRVESTRPTAMASSGLLTLADIKAMVHQGGVQGEVLLQAALSPCLCVCVCLLGSACCVPFPMCGADTRRAGASHVSRCKRAYRRGKHISARAHAQSHAADATV